MTHESHLSTLYGIVCGLMRKVREADASVDFIKDPKLTSIEKTLDAEMKRLRAIGLGVKNAKSSQFQLKKTSCGTWSCLGITILKFF